MAREIPPGMTGDLSFASKATGMVWEDGFCLVPSLFPALHYVGIYILWNIKAPEEYVHPEPKEICESRPVNQSALTMGFIGHSDVSFKQALLANFFTWVFVSFISVNPSNRRLVFQRIGQRILIATVALGFVSKAYTKVSDAFVQTYTSEKGYCYSVPKESPVKFFIRSYPQIYNMDEDLRILSPKVMTATWAELQSALPKNDNARYSVEIIASSTSGGKVCF